MKENIHAITADEARQATQAAILKTEVYQAANKTLARIYNDIRTACDNREFSVRYEWGKDGITEKDLFPDNIEPFWEPHGPSMVNSKTATHIQNMLRTDGFNAYISFSDFEIKWNKD